METPLPDELIICCLLFATSTADFDKLVTRNKLPVVQKDVATYALLRAVLKGRLKQYTTSIEVPFFDLHSCAMELMIWQEDEALLKQALTLRHREAVIVRLGEKRVLQHALTTCKAAESKAKRPRSEGASQSTGKKRKT